MKKLLVLLTVVTLVSSTTGCGIGRRIRDRICRGAYCGSSSVVAPPTQTPIIMAPQAAAPMMAYPSYGACYPCDPCCDPCGGSTMYDSGWQGADCGCNGASTGYYDGAISSGIPTEAGAASTFRDPGPTQ